MTLGGTAIPIFASMLVGPVISIGAVAGPAAALVEAVQPGRRRDAHGLIAAGKVTPVIDRRFPLSEIVEALRYVDDKRAKGKVIITMA